MCLPVGGFLLPDNLSQRSISQEFDHHPYDRFISLKTAVKKARYFPRWPPVPHIISSYVSASWKQKRGTKCTTQDNSKILSSVHLIKKMTRNCYKIWLVLMSAIFSVSVKLRHSSCTATSVYLQYHAVDRLKDMKRVFLDSEEAG